MLARYDYEPFGFGFGPGFSPSPPKEEKVLNFPPISCFPNARGFSLVFKRKSREREILERIWENLLVEYGNSSVWGFSICARSWNSAIPRYTLPFFQLFLCGSNRERERKFAEEALGGERERASKLCEWGLRTLKALFAVNARQGGNDENALR